MTASFRLCGNASFADVSAKMAEYGYRRVPAVEEEGDWSVRGCVLDVWSPGDEMPVRAEFFGDSLESLRSFDPATQLSVKRLDAAEILPADEGRGCLAAQTQRCTGVIRLSVPAYLPPEKPLCRSRSNS